MISFNKALETIKNNVKTSSKNELIDINVSFNRILNSNLNSNCNYPRADLSSMDGAVIFKQDINLHSIKVAGEIKAGDINPKDFRRGETKLIYTGAEVPGKNKLIIPKENFVLLNQKNSLKIIMKKPFDYIRKKGSDFKFNELCLKQGTIMNLRAISLAAAMRIKKISVKKKPEICVIVTGDELIPSKNKESLVTSTNQIVIKKIVEQFGGNLRSLYLAKDNLDDLEKKINNLGQFDILLTSGGISRGKYDLVKKVLEKKKLKILFDRVSIKPGKPTTFGVFPNGKYFLGLPGNPVSCFTSLIFFFSKIINKFYGINYINISNRTLIINNNLKKNQNLTTFLRIKLLNKNNYFNVLTKQDSAHLKVLNDSHGILIRKPFEKELLANTKCKVILFNDIGYDQI